MIFRSAIWHCCQGRIMTLTFGTDGYSLSHTEYVSVGNLPLGQVCTISSDRWCGWCWASGLVDCCVALGIPFALSLAWIRFWTAFQLLFEPALDDAGLTFFQMRAISSSCFRDGVHRSSLLPFDVLFAFRRRYNGARLNRFAFRLGVHRS